MGIVKVQSPQTNLPPVIKVGKTVFKVKKS